MFVRPSFLPLFSGIWLVPAVLGILIGPWPHWWTVLFPPPYAQVITLQNAPYFDADSGCRSGAAEGWREIRASGHAWSWFEALAAEGNTPAARLYGLVGLAAIAPARVPQTLSRLRPGATSEDVRFWRGEAGPAPWDETRVLLGNVVDSTTLVRLAELLDRMRARAEC